MAKIETRTTDLGLNGKIIRLGVMNSIYSAVENEIKKGAKTIIAVGNNNLFNQVINSVAKINALHSFANIPVGFIPVGKKDNNLACYLGIPLNEDACDVLSARRVQVLDLGKVNDNYFLFNSSIATKGTTVEIDKNFTIEITKNGTINIVNLPVFNIPKEVNCSADDGLLELIINTENSVKFLSSNKKKENNSVFSFKKLRIINNSLPINIDSSVSMPTPVEITIAKEKISLIVGKDRKF